MSLDRGDVVITGTSAGAGAARKPPFSSPTFKKRGHGAVGRRPPDGIGRWEPGRGQEVSWEGSKSLVRRRRPVPRGNAITCAAWQAFSVPPPGSPRILDPTRSSVPRAADRIQFPRGGYFVPPQATPQVHQPTRRGAGLVFPAAVPGHSA